MIDLIVVAAFALALGLRQLISPCKPGLPVSTHAKVLGPTQKTSTLSGSIDPPM